MTEDKFERYLRERFSDLRTELQQATPAFAVPTVRRSPWRPRPLWAAAAAVVLVVAGGWYFVSSRGAQVPFEVDMTTTVWVAPTDFLLDTPGRELLGSVPTVDIGVPFSEEMTQEVVDTSG
jgi:hypothetical protein